MDDMLRALKSSEREDGQDRIYAAGEIEFECEQQRLSNGIPYHSTLAGQLRDLASEFDVPLEVQT